HLMMQPPTFGSQINAGMMPENENEETPSGTPLSLPALDHPGALLDRRPLQSQTSPMPEAPVGNPMAQSTSLPPPPPPEIRSLPRTQTNGRGQTEPPLIAEESLSSLERDVKSPHLDYIESPVPN